MSLNLKIRLVWNEPIHGLCCCSVSEEGKSFINSTPDGQTGWLGRPRQPRGIETLFGVIKLSTWQGLVEKGGFSKGSFTRKSDFALSLKVKKRRQYCFNKKA